MPNLQLQELKPWDFSCVIREPEVVSVFGGGGHTGNTYIHSRCNFAADSPTSFMPDDSESRGEYDITSVFVPCLHQFVTSSLAVRDLISSWGNSQQ
jgi:hypothetical protein